jgi:LuxR family maltose regulon positive regulatory protein
VFEGSPSGIGRLIERQHEGGKSPYKPQAGEESLSTRERSVLKLIGDGKSNKKIERAINVSPETVQSHIKNIFVKLAVERRVHTVSRTHRLGVVGEHRA